MPSYKEKYEFTVLQLSDMDRRVLIAESTLSYLKDQLNDLTLQRERDKEESESDIFIKNQFTVALGEVESLLYGEVQTRRDLSSRPTVEIIRVATESLIGVAKVLRESQGRAEMMLEGIDIQPKGKLIKRERREQMRKESISSLAASLAASPPSLMSPPAIPRRRDDSPFSGRSSRAGKRDESR